MAFYPGQRRWAGTRRNIHSLTPCLCGYHTASLISFLHFLQSIAFPLHIVGFDSLFLWLHSKFSLACLEVLHLPLLSTFLRTCYFLTCVQVEVLRMNDFMALVVRQRKDYVANGKPIKVNTTLQIQPVVYVGGVPPRVTLPDFTDDLMVC